MTAKVYILNGPNLNLLGKRQPEIYGSETLSDIEKKCTIFAKSNNFEILFRQSNAEHELIDWIQEARFDAKAIIINPAAYSHTSIAILDALNAFEGTVIEVHLSDIYKREKFRHHSYTSLRADNVLAGHGPAGYLMALQIVASIIKT